MLREECAVFVARTDAWLDRRGADVFGITHRGKRYFIANRYRDSERMVGFVYGDLMRDITTALLGETVFLFNEQWVVKGAEQGMKFAWHQDSGYVNFRDPGNAHRPYLTCWCALDDMTRGERNDIRDAPRPGRFAGNGVSAPARTGEQRSGWLRGQRSGRARGDARGQRGGVHEHEPAPQRCQHDITPASGLPDPNTPANRCGRPTANFGARPCRLLQRASTSTTRARMSMHVPVGGCGQGQTRRLDAIFS